MTAAEVLRALRERWWVLVAATVLAALAAYVYVKLPWVEPRWRSSVLIQATGRLDYGNFLALEKELRPLAEQVRQLGIMREVDRNLHTDLPPERMLDRHQAPSLSRTAARYASTSKTLTRAAPNASDSRSPTSTCASTTRTSRASCAKSGSFCRPSIGRPTRS